MHIAGVGWEHPPQTKTDDQAGFTMSQLAGPVIVVDDDDAVRNSLKFALELEGLWVRLFKDGAELLAVPDLPRNGCYVID